MIHQLHPVCFNVVNAFSPYIENRARGVHSNEISHLDVLCMSLLSRIYICGPESKVESGHIRKTDPLQAGQSYGEKKRHI